MNMLTAAYPQLPLLILLHPSVNGKISPSTFTNYFQAIEIFFEDNERDSNTESNA
jgi:hypothetical protein